MTDCRRPPLQTFRGRAAIVIGATLIANFASPAAASSEPATRLVSCRAENCLLVSGRRNNPASIVRINGHAVQVDGRRRWRVSLPMDTVRQWSALYARTIQVTMLDPKSGSESTSIARLPIGLLGHVTDLAMLEVSVR